ncbi:hypothetical protein [Kitasatospora sp. DSM 101779]|uniref:Rv1733c family protein n=1 Tax=Kitasatospora sp. DSM 101779 TaxID=2853165 RepID=UPI0021DAA2FD|nr:hypothetical protein [Kitasatospora sp. DSM 101779]MCU7826446.1 hypothetical protein [Kitasatospora sp. DSM 101779]
MAGTPSTHRAHGTRGTRPRQRHLRRALGIEHNVLARPSDRCRSRSLVLAALAVVVAALLGAAAARTDLGSAQRRSAAAAPHLHRVDAVLLTPTRNSGGTADAVAGRYRAAATWTYPSGQQNTGTVQLARPTPTGATTTVWVGDSGQLAPAPPSTADLVSDAVFRGLLVFGCLSVLTACALGLRLTRLNRRADAAWQRAWAELEPVWSGRAARKPGSGEARRG